MRYLLQLTERDTNIKDEKSIPFNSFDGIMYLLDRNICIALLKGNLQASSEFQQKFSRCHLATIVLAELYKGVYCSNQVENNLKNLNQFVELMSVINFDIQDAI